MLILVTGGSRSGKSRFALDFARGLRGPHAFIATAQAFDDEMRSRIEAHRKARPPEWRLVEEPLRLPGALAASRTAAATIVVDCVTLWISNLLLADEGFDERQAEEQALALVAGACEDPGASADEPVVIIVTNEVGSGVVPETPLGRRFRDCAGRANEVIARGADEVYLMVSGIPMRIKQQGGKVWNE